MLFSHYLGVSGSAAFLRSNERCIPAQKVSSENISLTEEPDLTIILGRRMAGGLMARPWIAVGIPVEK